MEVYEIINVMELGKEVYSEEVEQMIFIGDLTRNNGEWCVKFGAFGHTPISKLHKGKPKPKSAWDEFPMVHGGEDLDMGELSDWLVKYREGLKELHKGDS